MKVVGVMIALIVGIGREVVEVTSKQFCVITCPVTGVSTKTLT